MRNQRKQDTTVHPASANAQATTMTPNKEGAMQLNIRLAAILAALSFVVMSTAAWSCQSPLKATDANASEDAATTSQTRSYVGQLNELEMKFFGSVQPCNDGETEVECADRRMFAVLSAGEKQAFGEAKSCGNGESTSDCVKRRGDDLKVKWVDCGQCTEVCSRCARWIEFCSTNHGPVVYGKAANRDRKDCTPQCNQPAPPAQPSNGNNGTVTLIGQPGPFSLAFGDTSNTGTGTGTIGDVSSTGGGASQSQSQGGASVADSGNASQGQSQSQSASGGNVGDIVINVSFTDDKPSIVILEGDIIVIVVPFWWKIDGNPCPELWTWYNAQDDTWKRSAPGVQFLDILMRYCPDDSVIPETPVPGTAVPSPTVIIVDPPTPTRTPEVPPPTVTSVPPTPTTPPVATPVACFDHHLLASEGWWTVPASATNPWFAKGDVELSIPGSGWVLYDTWNTSWGLTDSSGNLIGEGDTGTLLITYQSAGLFAPYAANVGCLARRATGIDGLRDELFTSGCESGGCKAVRIYTLRGGVLTWVDRIRP